MWMSFRFFIEERFVREFAWSAHESVGLAQEGCESDPKWSEFTQRVPKV